MNTTTFSTCLRRIGAAALLRPRPGWFTMQVQTC